MERVTRFEIPLSISWTAGHGPVEQPAYCLDLAWPWWRPWSVGDGPRVARAPLQLCLVGFDLVAPDDDDRH